MSDTSIIERESSMEDNYYRKRGSCWTRIGANICVCILTFSTIFLLVALLFTLNRQQELEKFRRLEAKRNGKNIDMTAPSQGIFSFVQGIFGGSSDSNEKFYDGDDYVDS